MNKGNKKKLAAEHELLRAALASMQQSAGLPAQLCRARQQTLNGQDTFFQVAVQGAKRKYEAVVKQRLTNETLGYVISEFNQARDSSQILITSYMTPPQAEKLRCANIQFLDTAGNAFLNQPPLYVFVMGRRPREIQVQTKTKRAFTTASIKVIFALLSRPNLLMAPYRVIAAAANVSLGAVSKAMENLKTAGYLLASGVQGRVWQNPQELIRRWGEAYAGRLRPKLLVGRFQADKPDWWEEVNVAPINACWGSEVAAARLTGYLKPQIKTLYASTRLPALQVKYGFRPDQDGNVELLKKFWTFEGDPAHPDLTPPLLIYADLMASGDERNRETAEMIYDRYLAGSFGQT